MKHNMFSIRNNIIISVIVLLTIICYSRYQYKYNNNSPRFIVYGSMNCGFTVKMLNYLKNANQSVKFVDVNTKKGDLEFKRVTAGKNIRGVPYTKDNKTNKDIRGFQEIIL